MTTNSTFNAIIVNHTNPAISVIVADGDPNGSNGGVTYNQIRNSLGQQVYDVQAFYLYSTLLSQLIGTIKYNRYDINGNENITNIVTTVDPYQSENSVVVDLKQMQTQVILNGNSSIQTTLLPNAFLQMKLFAKRVTNAFQYELENFKSMDNITRGNFFENYGNPIDEIQKTNYFISRSLDKEEKAEADGKKLSFIGDIPKNDNVPIAFLSVAAVSIVLYFLSQKD